MITVNTFCINSSLVIEDFYFVFAVFLSITISVLFLQTHKQQELKNLYYDKEQ